MKKQNSWILLWLMATALILMTIACDSGTDTPDGDTEDSETTDGDADDTEISDGDDAETETDGDDESPPVETPVFSIIHQHPPTTAAGSTLSFQFEAENGMPPYNDWAITQGALPDGTTLDSANGLWSGTPASEGFFAFVVSVNDSEGKTADRLFAIRIGDPQAEGPIAAKARAYQENYEALHLRHGYSYDVIIPGEGNECESPCATTLGDATFLGGQCTMAAAYRAAVENSEAAKGVLRDLVDGWRFFERLTGVPGMVGRSFVHTDDSVDPRDRDGFENWPDTMWIKGEGEFDGWFWRSDTSRDQMTGAVLGMTMAYDLATDEHTKSEAAAFLTNVGNHILDNDLNIVDWDGEPTQYGLLDGESLEGLPVGNGLNAALLLAWIKIADHVSGDSRFSDFYDYLVDERDYYSILRDYQWVYQGYITKWYNTYMVFENFFHLMRLEQDPVRRAELKEIFLDTLWLNTDDTTPNRKAVLEHNAVKTPWYLYSTGTHDAKALYEALMQIHVFQDSPLRDHRVDLTGDPDITPNPDQPDEALYAIPINKRKPDMVMWHRGPYDLIGGSNNGTERTGCDFLLPYWMGRYYGFVNSEW